MKTRKLILIMVLVVSTFALSAAAIAVKRASNDSCKQCNIANENRICGKCGGFLSVTREDYDKGYLYTYYKCDNCGHTLYNKEKRH